MTGADVGGLRDLAATLYGYLPDITGVIATLNLQAAQLTGDAGWRGPAAAAFTAAWQHDAATVEALAQVVAWTADVVDDLAAELAAIEQTPEEAARVAAARQATERAAARLSDLHAVFTAGREALARPVVGDPAGSIAGVAVADVVQAGVGDQAADAVVGSAGHLWDGVITGS